MSSRTPLPRTGMALRAREKDSQKHPGKPDLPRPRRPTVTVQAERAEKARAQTKREDMRAQNIQEAADIETQIEEQMKEKLMNAHHPHPSTQKKVLHPHTKAPGASNGAISDISRSEGAAHDGAPCDSDEEYNPNGRDPAESEDDESDVLDKSESGEEPTRRARKKKSSQGSLRAAVHAAQGKNVQEGGDLKRKASLGVEESVSQKRYKKANTGLYKDWPKKTWVEDPVQDDIEGDVDIPMADTDHSQSRSASSIVSFSSSSRPTASLFNSDDDCDQEGGIADDAGEISERTNLAGNAVCPSTPKSSHYGGGSKFGEARALACIVTTTSVPTFIKPSTSSLIAQTRRKKGDIRLCHLSNHLQARFVEEYTPRLYELFGTLMAWEQPIEADLQRLWKSVFPHERSLDFQTSEGIIALKLVEDRLSHWRKRFGERGLETLEEITFNDLPMNDTAHRQWWCHWALSGDDDSCRPFYYSTYEEPDPEVEGSKLTIKGIFQSPLIAAILGTHMTWICAIDDNIRSNKKPVGALVHSIQAAKRAISWWETGELVKPKRPFNEYSKVNWGDHIETREGRAIHITSTSELVTIVSKLKDKQWDKILTAARLSAKRKKRVTAVIAEPPPPPLTALVELRDDDSDLAEENEYSP